MRGDNGWGWRHGRGVAGTAVLVAGLVTFHRHVPNTVGHLGSLLEAFLPWLGLTVPVLAVLALRRRALSALVTLLLPVLAWSAAFGARLMPADTAGPGTAGITVVQHNAADDNADPAGTARSLASARPDLIALEELTAVALPVYEDALAHRYPHHVTYGTVGLWSAYPLTDVRPLDIKPRGLAADWRRAVRAVAHTPGGDIAVYVAHLPSVRAGLTKGFDTAWRDDSAGQLGAALAAEPLPRLILLGDLNGTVEDRGLRPVTSRLTWAPAGFAASWPAGLPVARIDQVMARSATVTRIWTLPATGSDHLPVAARVRW